MNNDFWVDYNTNTNRHSSCHFHPYYEICYFETGSRTYTVGERYYSIYSNSVILIKPYIQHSTKGSSHSTRTVLYFEADLLQKYFSPALSAALLRCFDEPVRILETADTEVKTIVKKIREADGDNNEALCALLLAQLMARLCSTQPTEKPEVAGSPITASVITYVHENIHWLNNIDTVARHFNISASYLSSVFKNDVGIPIKHYIINLRINMACKALVLTDKSVSEISRSSGFASASHFCNTFKKVYDVRLQA